VKGWHLLAIVPVSIAAAHPQQNGTIRGNVLDKDFEGPLEGVEVRVLETGSTALSDAQGNFSLPDLPPGQYTLVFSRPDYLRQVRSGVVVNPGRLTDLTVSLPADFTDLPEFVVEDLLGGSASSEAALLALRFETPALVDSIGSDLMSRAGASDAASAARLIPGVSTQGDKFAVIRGLPDRYVSSQLNSVRLPSANEDKRAVELDQYPANILESVQVSKTFTPDQQGDASGGAINVKLRDIPEEPIVQFRGQFGGNSQVTGIGNFLTYNGGGLDFFGNDGGSRDIQFENLGGNWDGAAGVTEGAAPIDSRWSIAAGGSQKINEDWSWGGFGTFFYERDSSFYDDGRNDALFLENPGQGLVPQFAFEIAGAQFVTSLFDITRASQSVSLGSLMSFGLSSERNSLGALYLTTHTAEDVAILAEDTRGKEFYFPGYDVNDPDDPGNQLDEPGFKTAPYLRTETLEYTERTTRTFQLRGEHRLDTEPLSALGGNFEFQQPVIDWAASKNYAKQYQPDRRQFGSYWVPPVDSQFVANEIFLPLPPADNINLGNFQRIWEDIREDGNQVTANLRLPFEQWTLDKGELKFGGFRDDVKRGFNQDTFANFQDSVAANGFPGTFDDFWSANWENEDHAITASEFDVDYAGRQQIQAVYGMIDLPLSEQVSVVTGVRLEGTQIEIQNDPEQFALWFPPQTNPAIPTAPTILTPGAADVDFSQNDVLPAIGLEYEPSDQVTLRAAYSQTVARQTFKELSPIIQQEFLGGPVFIGNPDLGMASLQNYDLRADYTPQKGSLLSLSWFYKDVQDPIEYIQRQALFDFTTPVNYPEGRLFGWELEGRQQLDRFSRSLEGFGVILNGTLIDSEVTVTPAESALFADPVVLGEDLTKRGMLNAPEYLYNLGLTFDNEARGLAMALFYSVSGDTLVAGAGIAQGTQFVPDVYQEEVGTLNFSLSQRLGPGLQIQFQARNLTNPEIQEVYRSEFIGPDVLRSTYTRGIDFSLGLTFTF
jgi:outer membrane receptor protein involved in Fe transport